MSTPSQEGSDSLHTPGSEPANTSAANGSAQTPAASEPAETLVDMPTVADPADDPAEREPSGALAPEEMAFVQDTDEPAVGTPAVEQTAVDMPVVDEPAATPETGAPAFDTFGREEPAYDTLGPEEPKFDTFAPEDPQVAEAVAGAAPNWPPLVRKLTLGQAIVLVTGVLLFVWGFLPWYSDAGGSANAWSTETIPGLLLTATWVPLLSLAIVVFIAIKVFGNGFPDKILGFTWTQLSMVVGLFDVLITLGFLVANRSLGSLGSLDLGAGLILSFITSLILLGGAVMDYLEKGTDYFSASRRRVRAPR